MDLIDKKTGKPVAVPDAQVADAFKTGNYGLPAGAKIRVKDGSTVGTIKPEDAAAAFEQGMQVATPEEFAHAEKERKYGGLKGQAIAGGAGLARGLTVGLSDPLAIALTGAVGGSKNAEKLRTTLKDTKEVNPGLSVGSEVLGAVAPALLSGGESVAAEGLQAAEKVAEGTSLMGKAINAGRQVVKGAGVLPRGIAAAGEGVEHVLEKAVASAVGHGSTGLLGNIAKKAIPLAGGSAVEGALFGAGSAVSDAALENEELTAEKVMAAAGHGALIAGGIGGAIGTGSAVISKAVDATSDALRPLAKKLLGADTLEGLASGHAFQSLRPSLKFVKKAEGLEGGMEGVGRALKDELPEVVGKPFARMDAEDFAKGTAALKTREGEKLGTMFDHMESVGAKPDMSGLMQKIEAKVLKPLAETPGAENVLGRVQKYTESLNAAPDMGFKKLWETRKYLDDLIYGDAAPGQVTPYQKAMRDVRGLMEKEITESGVRASKEVGGDFATDYAKTKKAYAQFNVASRAAEDRLSRDAANKFTTMGDQQMGLGTLMAFGGNPVGAAAGVVSTLASRAVRMQGHQLISEGLDKLAKVTAIQRLTGEVDAQVNKSLTHFFSKHVEEAVARGEAGFVGKIANESRDKHEPLHTRYEHAVAQVGKVAGNPELMTANLAPHLEPLQKHTPTIASAVATKAANATEFLNSKIPPTQPDMFRPNAKPRVSEAQMAQFLKYKKAVDNPTSVIVDMSQGRISREGVEALKAVAPELYKEVQLKAIDMLSTFSQKHELPYQKQLQLSILLDIPTPTTDRSFISQMQKSFAGQSGQQAQPGQSSRPVNVAKFVSTPLDSLDLEGRQ